MAEALRYCRRCGVTFGPSSPCRCPGASPVKADPRGDDSGMIAGVDPDAPTVVNASGGKQSRSLYRCDLLPAKATLAVASVLEYGVRKYTLNNWRLIPTRDHINHALVHLFAFLAGDTSDDHLGHAACRALMALELHLDGKGES